MPAPPTTMLRGELVELEIDLETLCPPRFVFYSMLPTVRQSYVEAWLSALALWHSAAGHEDDDNSGE